MCARHPQISVDDGDETDRIWMDEMNHRFVYSDALKHEQNESEKARMEIGNGNRVLRQREGDQRHRMLDELCVRAISPKCYELIRTDKMK